MTGAFRYRHCGLVLESPALLPLRADATPDAQADVTITLGALPSDMPDFVEARPHFHLYADGSCVLRSPQGIKFHLVGGRTVRVDAPDGLDQRDLRAWLLGPALALILHQRGLPPLHATAVTVAGSAVAIAGDSGFGKSTTARALVRRGHRILSDDHTVVDPATRTVHPGAAGLRLWADVADLFGDPIAEAARVRVEENKFTIRQPALFDTHPRPLSTVFALSPAPTSRPMVERLTPGRAMPMLHRNVVRLRLATIMGAAPTIFRWASLLAGSVKVYALHRPLDLARLDELAGLIEHTVGQG